MSRTVVIGGAGPLLGTAIAREFADAGWSVGLLARSTDVTEPLAAELRDSGTAAVAVTADVTEPTAVETAFETVREELGQIETLVHNAAVRSRGPIDNCDPEGFERVWRVRAYGGFVCVQAALADLRATNGTVLFTGSSYATDPGGRMVDWDSGAAATRGLARSLAADLIPDGVQVTYASIGASVAGPDDTRGESAVNARDVAVTFRELAEHDSVAVETVEITPRGTTDE